MWGREEGPGHLRPGPKWLLLLSRDRGDDVVARLLAATASLDAHPAVLVVGGVLLALRTAKAARLGAGPKGSPRHLGLEGRLAGEDTSRGVAHIGAVEVETYAAGQRFGFVLAEAGVSAGGAALGAVEAGLYTPHQRGGVHRSGARVSL